MKTQAMNFATRKKTGGRFMSTSVMIDELIFIAYTIVAASGRGHTGILVSAATSSVPSPSRTNTCPSSTYNECH
jgi:hypothetical protein